MPLSSIVTTDVFGDEAVGVESVRLRWSGTASFVDTREELRRRAAFDVKTVIHDKRSFADPDDSRLSFPLAQPDHDRSSLCVDCRRGEARPVPADGMAVLLL